MKKVVLDTNVLLMSLPKRSPYRPIFDGLINGKFLLLLTEGIFQEYIEIVSQKTTAEIGQNLGNLLLQLRNVQIITVYFHWKLITEDPDDNKFVDCAATGNADCIVTNDHHFGILNQIEFPRVQTIRAEDFLTEVLSYPESNQET